MYLFNFGKLKHYFFFTYIGYILNLQLVTKDILAQTVHGNVHLTVSPTHVDTRTDFVVVLQDGLVIPVPQVNFCRGFDCIFSNKACNNSIINTQCLLYGYQNNLMFVYTITIQCVLQMKYFKDYVFFSLIIYFFLFFKILFVAFDVCVPVNLQFVIMDTLAHTAYGNVHLTVSLAHVDTLTGGVLVMLVGWDIIVPKVFI